MSSVARGRRRATSTVVGMAMVTVRTDRPPVRSRVMSTAAAQPRYRFERGARYLVTVRDAAGADQNHRLDAYQGWLTGPDGIRHRFGQHRRARVELRDADIRAVVGP